MIQTYTETLPENNSQFLNGRYEFPDGRFSLMNVFKNLQKREERGCNWQKLPESDNILRLQEEQPRGEENSR